LLCVVIKMFLSKLNDEIVDLVLAQLLCRCNSHVIKHNLADNLLDAGRQAVLAAVSDPVASE